MSVSNQKLESLKISRARYDLQMQALSSANFTKKQANSLILKKSSNNTVTMVLECYKDLINIPYSLTQEQIIKIAGHIGGSRNIEAIKEFFHDLIKLGLTQNQVLKIAAHGGGSKNIQAILANFNKLSSLDLTPEQIVKTVVSGGLKKN